jgi:DNA-binding CsgD family transcriptional regulator
LPEFDRQPVGLICWATVKLERLVQRIYDGVTEDGLERMMKGWPEQFRSIGGHTMVLDPHGDVVDGAHHEFAGGQLEYEQHWRDLDPRMSLARSSPGRVFSDIQHIEPKAFERSDVYHAVMRPFGARYSLFGSMPLARGYTLAQGMMRGPSAGAYDDDEVRTLMRLWPHLRRGIDLRLELGTLRSRVADLVNALDAMPSPVFVLDHDTRIQHYNAAAARLVDTHDGLSIKNQRLLTSHPKTTAQLRATISNAIAFADAASTGDVPAITVVEVARATGSPLALVVHPLRPRNALRARGHARARALVVVHDPDARPRVDPSLIASVHDLTPTEAELAAALAEGKSLAEFAVARGCTEATARTHLKRVLEKTGTRRQAELVHRILASTALHLVRPL